MSLTLLVQSVLAGITNGFVYGLVGMGLATIFRGARIINAMQGEFGVVAGMVAVVVAGHQGVPLPLAMLAGVIAGGLIGWAIDVVLVRALRKRGGSEDSFLLLTLGIAFAISASVLYIAGRDARLLPGLGGEAMVEIAEAAMRVHAIWLIVVSVVVVSALRLFYSRTVFGMSMLAASIDPEGAATTGIDVAAMRTATFVLGGLLGGLAGVLVTPLTTVHYDMGMLLTLKGFAAAILGGLGNPFGALVGGLTLALLESLAVISVPSGYKDVVALSILVIIMIVMPGGILGRAGRKGG